MVVFSILKSATCRGCSLFNATKSSLRVGLNSSLQKCIGYNYKIEYSIETIYINY